MPENRRASKSGPILEPPPHHQPGNAVTALISQKVLTKSCCKRPFPHRSVNQFFILVTIKSVLTSLCGNGLLQNDFISISVWKTCRHRSQRQVSHPGPFRDLRIKESCLVKHKPSERDTAPYTPYTGTSLRKNSAPLGPCSKTMPRALWWP